jgi:hypothetical protein
LIWRRSNCFVNSLTFKDCPHQAHQITLEQLLTPEAMMQQPRTRQLLLPFADENDPAKQLPKENHDRCRALLARLLLQTVRAENERGSNEHREDSNDPS